MCLHCHQKLSSELMIGRCFIPSLDETLFKVLQDAESTVSTTSSDMIFDSVLHQEALKRLSKRQRPRRRAVVDGTWYMLSNCVSVEWIERSLANFLFVS